MINWVSLLFHVAWIVGCAIILAAFSYNHWQANQQKQPLRKQLYQPEFTQPALSGLVLVTVGLTGTSKTIWEAIIWGIFLLVVVYHLLKSLLPSANKQK